MNVASMLAELREERESPAEANPRVGAIRFFSFN